MASLKMRKRFGLRTSQTRITALRVQRIIALSSHKLQYGHLSAVQMSMSHISSYLQSPKKATCFLGDRTKGTAADI